MLVRRIAASSRNGRYDAVSVGYPGQVDAAGPTQEPGNLGNGWVSFDYEKALGKPVRIVNDAVMQALGAFDGGRMLSLGWAPAWVRPGDRTVVVPLELGQLPYPRATPLRRVLAERRSGSGERTMAADYLAEVVPALRRAFAADYVVFGGGLADQVNPIPREPAVAATKTPCSAGSACGMKTSNPTTASRPRSGE